MDSLDQKLDQLMETCREASRADRPVVVVELLGSYLRHRPDHAYAWFLYGDTLRELGRTSEAEIALKRALSLRADETWFIEARLAMLCVDAGRREDAES